MFRICPLFSGSSGNSAYIQLEKASPTYAGLNFESVHKPISILIDAGMSGKRIESSMNQIEASCTELDAILLTHEHIDHMAGIGVLVRRYRIPLYISSKTWEALQHLNIGKIPEDLVHLFEPGDDFCIRDIRIKSFSVPHDAVDSVGFRVHGPDSSVSFITDIGEIKDDVMSEISGSKAVFIESNYDKDMLFEGPYPWPLKRRIDGVRGHLSNFDCAAAAKTLLESGTEYFVLSHLSSENNTPEIAYKATVDHLRMEGAEIQKDYELQLAPRYSPGKPWDI